MQDVCRKQQHVHIESLPCEVCIIQSYPHPHEASQENCLAFKGMLCSQDSLVYAMISRDCCSQGCLGYGKYYWYMPCTFVHSNCCRLLPVIQVTKQPKNEECKQAILNRGLHLQSYSHLIQAARCLICLDLCSTGQYSWRSQAVQMPH